MFKVFCVGNLTNDPEARVVGNDTVTNFGIAVNGGKDATIFARVAVWGKRGDVIREHFHKGSKIAVSGKMGVPRTYTGRDGKVGVSLDITLEDFDFCERRTGDADDSGVRAAPTPQLTPVNEDLPY